MRCARPCTCQSCIEDTRAQREEAVTEALAEVLEIGRVVPAGDYLCWCGKGKAPKTEHSGACQKLYAHLEEYNKS